MVAGEYFGKSCQPASPGSVSNLSDLYKWGALPHPVGSGGGGPTGACGADYGTTAERFLFGAALSSPDDNGCRFFDTDLGELFVWINGAWSIPVLTPASNRGVSIYLGDEATVLLQPYRPGDLWIDDTAGRYEVRVCRASPITNTRADWIAVGRQNGRWGP